MGEWIYKSTFSCPRLIGGEWKKSLYSPHSETITLQYICSSTEVSKLCLFLYVMIRGIRKLSRFFSTQKWNICLPKCCHIPFKVRAQLWAEHFIFHISMRTIQNPVYQGLTALHQAVFGLCINAHWRYNRAWRKIQPFSPNTQERYTRLEGVTFVPMVPVPFRVTATSAPDSALWKKNSVAFSPQANYANWTTATCWRNLVPTLADRGVSCGQRGGSPTVVNQIPHSGSIKYFKFKRQSAWRNTISNRWQANIIL
jgi:hypothetical protein